MLRLACVEERGRATRHRRHTGEEHFGRLCEEVDEETCCREAAGENMETGGAGCLWRRVEAVQGAAGDMKKHRHWRGKRDSWGEIRGEGPTQD